MKHLIETADSSSLATVPYDRIVLDSTTNEIVCKGGGYEYVDLGLPSGLKWAKCNVGAESETDYGYYFQWGDIVDKSNADCSWATYKHCNGSGTTLTKYCTNGDGGPYGKVDNKTTLDTEDDAAAQIMGGDWRMPTRDELEELLDKTNNGGATINGVRGRKFTSKTDESKYIFIPNSGYRSGSSFFQQGSYVNLWSSSLHIYFPNFAVRYESYDDIVSTEERYVGFPVRGVFK